QKSLELTIIDPEKNVKLVLVKNPVTIGSSYDCQINLNDYSVSSEHCYIGKTKNGFFVVDLNSCNGIKVNNNEVDKTFLKDNDTILIGETIIEVKEIFVE
ncbi:MAG: FHA domain-containing protein, partial [Caldisericia bacterium]|nr:FHA domain-containing protein [Caldisericia bacterium]